MLISLRARPYVSNDLMERQKNTDYAGMKEQKTLPKAPNPCTKEGLTLQL